MLYRAVYRLAIMLLQVITGIGGFFSPKLRAFYLGHRHAIRHWRDRLPTQEARAGRQLVWLHASSLGEYEQGRPVLDALRTRYPNLLVAVSFFSPSGYDAITARQTGDIVGYLPFDYPGQARELVSTIKPDLVIWSKYDYWYNVLKYIHLSNIPNLLISSIFRPSQPFFRWYGPLHRQMLLFFHHLFLQDDISYNLLISNDLNTNKLSINGDTRFDRVCSIASANIGVPELQDWLKDKATIWVAGSTWPEDDKWLVFIRQNYPAIQLIVAPHEVHPTRINQLKERFPEAACLSESNHAAAPVLIVDRIGLLSRLYTYASVCWIGGGFSGTGVHNVLEAAVYGRPVLFGPNHQKYAEVGQLIAAGGGMDIQNEQQLAQWAEASINHSDLWEKSGRAAARFVQEQAGATDRIVSYIERNRLLTT